MKERIDEVDIRKRTGGGGGGVNDGKRRDRK